MASTQHTAGVSGEVSRFEIAPSRKLQVRGRQNACSITLTEVDRTYPWKPMRHKIAVGSSDQADFLGGQAEIRSAPFQRRSSISLGKLKNKDLSL